MLFSWPNCALYRYTIATMFNSQFSTQQQKKRRQKHAVISTVFVTLILKHSYIVFNTFMCRFSLPLLSFHTNNNTNTTNYTIDTRNHYNYFFFFIISFFRPLSLFYDSQFKSAASYLISKRTQQINTSRKLEMLFGSAFECDQHGKKLKSV